MSDKTLTDHADEVLLSEEPAAVLDPPPAEADPVVEAADEDNDPLADQPAAFAASELFLPGESVELAEDDGFIVKTILRTGEWTKTPGSKGVRRTPLRVVRDGVSSAKDGIIALSELVESFGAKAYQYVTIPLSDDAKDHKNLTHLNTGFVRDVWIEDGEDGISRLKAKLHFTEPDVREKVKRGTIPDVSAGVYFNVERPDGSVFNSALNHVCLTKSPFIDGMEPFGVLASDDEVGHPDEVESFVPAEEAEERPDWDSRLSFNWQKERVMEALRSQLELGEHYTVTDIAPERAIVTNKIAETSWVVPFQITESSVSLAGISEWSLQEEVSEEGSEVPEEPAATPEVVGLSDESQEVDPLMQARQMRGLRSRSNTYSEGGEVMSVRTDPLEGIDLSDTDAIRARMIELASENQSLRSVSRKSEIDSEIERVKGLGFEEAPGFLRVYRDILMSDDEQPAAVLLSHDDSGNVVEKKTVTATEIAKRLIDALPTEEKDGETRVMLSAQHLTSGNEVPPPATAEGETEKSVKDRTREAEEALYGKSQED